MMSASRYRHYESGRDCNFYEADRGLQSALRFHLDDATWAWAPGVLAELGERAGGPWARRADVYDRAGHELVRYDRFGRDVSEICYHPDWLASLNEVFDFGVVGWNADERRVADFRKAPAPLLAAFDYLVGQADMALCCPVELSHGTALVLERHADPGMRQRLLPRVLATDSASRLLCANVFTEVTGGSDTGASRTVARRAGDGWLLDGEKWFASNCGADLVVTLARVDDVPGLAGLGLFIVPGWRDDGRRNLSIRRLKEKMGTIGVPTGEMIFQDSEAWLVGDASAGYRYVFDLLNETRFWNGVGSVGVARRAYLEAAVHAARREAFGQPIDSFPMVREQLTWLTVDLAVTVALLLHVASAREAAPLRFRTLAPLLKYRGGEQNVVFARAAVEMLGGNGYTYPFPTARLLRDAQVNPIWEGTSNIVALDAWRAVVRDRGHDPVLDEVERLLAEVRTPAGERLAEATIRGVKDVREAIDALGSASDRRQAQQARRFADLFGDVVGLGALTAEADADAAGGDHTKALVGELFAARLEARHNRLDAVLRVGDAVLDAYPLLVGDEPCPEEDYRALV